MAAVGFPPRCLGHPRTICWPKPRLPQVAGAFASRLLAGGGSCLAMPRWHDTPRHRLDLERDITRMLEGRIYTRADNGDVVPVVAEATTPSHVHTLVEWSGGYPTWIARQVWRDRETMMAIPAPTLNISHHDCTPTKFVCTHVWNLHIATAAWAYHAPFLRYVAWAHFGKIPMVWEAFDPFCSHREGITAAAEAAVRKRHVHTRVLVGELVAQAHRRGD